MNCPLCLSPGEFLVEFRGKEYGRCSRCRSVFMFPAGYLSRAEEKEHYLTHNNDVTDPRYQQFVSPIVKAVLQRYRPGQTGLDFGAGSGPVISLLLRSRGYSIELYDPFFWDFPEALQPSYDFIVCCEVIEHFHSPAREFALLRSLLKPGGTLYCMTVLYREAIDFLHWYYKNDPTHVFFYHPKAIEWIQNHCGFSQVSVKNRLIEFVAQA